MKIKLHPHRRRGATIWLALLILILFLIFTGLLIRLWIKVRKYLPGNPKEQTAELVVETATASPPSAPGTFSMSYEFSGLQEALEASGDTNAWFATVQRSTNLVHWTNLYTVPLSDGIEVNDDAAPWPNAFYRALIWREE